jgi:hypothetical protein
MTLQMISMVTEHRDEDDGTVSLRFTLAGLAPGQVEGVGERVADGIKTILADYAKDGHVDMIRPGDLQ